MLKKSAQMQEVHLDLFAAVAVVRVAPVLTDAASTCALTPPFDFFRLDSRVPAQVAVAPISRFSSMALTDAIVMGPWLPPPRDSGSKT